MSIPDDIYITDTKTPIMLLVGSISCGKSMVAYRLFKYLYDIGYLIDADTTLMASASYRNRVKWVQRQLFNEEAADYTNEPVLFQVRNKTGWSILQVLDTLGIDWYNPSDKGDCSFPFYINKITHSTNPKIWVYFTEPKWETSKDRNEYVNKIQNLLTMAGKKDKHIILYNKIDLNCWSQDNRRDTFVKMDIENKNPGMIDLFRNKSWITSFFRKYNCAILTFCTGHYTEQKEGCYRYCPASDNYPKSLWGTITKYI